MAATADEVEYKELSLKSIIGFGGGNKRFRRSMLHLTYTFNTCPPFAHLGNVPGGYTKHPNGIHKVYSLGSTVVVADPKKGTQEFLQGHTNVVSCIAISKDGKYIASGQVTHMGFQVSAV